MASVLVINSTVCLRHSIWQHINFAWHLNHFHTFLQHSVFRQQQPARQVKCRWSLAWVNHHKHIMCVLVSVSLLYNLITFLYSFFPKLNIINSGLRMRVLLYPPSYQEIFSIQIVLYLITSETIKVLDFVILTFPPDNMRKAYNWWQVYLNRLNVRLPALKRAAKKNKILNQFQQQKLTKL